MVSLVTQSERRKVRGLEFCYICGLMFEAGQKTDHDHVPPETCFPQDRRDPLKLKTHAACNGARSDTDKRIGQLISLRYGSRPASRRDRALKFQAVGAAQVAVTNIDVEAEIWRWISGFHAALYSEPLLPNPMRAVSSPFPRGSTNKGGQVEFEPLFPQHPRFVEPIKLNRYKRNLDVIHANNGMLKYECVWVRRDDDAVWICVFALDICDWKDLGDPHLRPRRGCAGFYAHADGHLPPNATTSLNSPIIIPNLDPFDPFGP